MWKNKKHTYDEKKKGKVIFQNYEENQKSAKFLLCGKKIIVPEMM